MSYSSHSIPVLRGEQHPCSWRWWLREPRLSQQSQVADFLCVPKDVGVTFFFCLFCFFCFFSLLPSPHPDCMTPLTTVLPALLCAVEGGHPLAGTNHPRGDSERWGLVQNCEEQARGASLAGCWPPCAVLEIDCLAPLLLDFPVCNVKNVVEVLRVN